MPKAKPLNNVESLTPAIARLRQIAAEAADHLLLSDGPPHPDRELLELCGTALHHLTVAEKAYSARPAIGGGDWTDQTRRHDAELMADYYRHNGVAQGALTRAKKLRANTAAGIYAKALCVRASRTGAAAFAMTLADDLVSNAALRASLWATVPKRASAAAGNVVPLPMRSRSGEEVA